MEVKFSVMSFEKTAEKQMWDQKTKHQKNRYASWSCRKSVGTKPKRISTSEPEQKVLALKRKRNVFFSPRPSEWKNNHKTVCPICKQEEKEGSMQLVNLLNNRILMSLLKAIKGPLSGMTDTDCA